MSSWKARLFKYSYNLLSHPVGAFYFSTQVVFSSSPSVLQIFFSSSILSIFSTVSDILFVGIYFPFNPLFLFSSFLSRETLRPNIGFPPIFPLAITSCLILSVQTCIPIFLRSFFFFLQTLLPRLFFPPFISAYNSTFVFFKRSFSLRRNKMGISAQF